MSPTNTFQTSQAAKLASNKVRVCNVLLQLSTELKRFPTLKETAKAYGCKSVSNIHQHITDLIKSGAITKDGDTVSITTPEE